MQMHWVFEGHSVGFCWEGKVEIFFINVNGVCCAWREHTPISMDSVDWLFTPFEVLIFSVYIAIFNYIILLLLL